MKSISNIAQQGWEYLSIEHIPWFYTLGFLLTLTGVIALSIFTELYVIAGAAAAAVPLVVIVIRYPRLWLYLSVMLWTVWFRTSDEGVSFLDTVMVAFYLGGLAVWFIGKLFNRKKVVESVADRLFILFFVLGIGNTVVAVANGVSLLMWVREYLLLSFLLYAFPIRDLFYEKKELKKLLFVMALTVSVIGVLNLQLYIQAASNAIYAFNILSSRVSLNETVFLGGALISIAFLLYARSLFGKMAFLILSSFYAAVLIASFTRGAWLTFIVGIIGIFYFLSVKRKIILGGYVVSGIALFVLVVSLFFGSLGDIIFRNIETRFTSSGKGSADISVNARLIESNAVIAGILDYPLGGAGMGAPVTFYDIIARRTTTPTFSHNGYLFVAYKLGAGMSLLLLITFLLYLYYGFLAIRKVHDPFYRAIGIGAFVSLVAALIITLTSNQLATRHGVCTMAAYVAFIGIIHRYSKNVMLQIEHK